MNLSRRKNLRFFGQIRIIPKITFNFYEKPAAFGQVTTCPYNILTEIRH